MSTEIERKFLIINDNWKKSVHDRTNYIQGYFATNKDCSIRIRIAQDCAFLNIKSATLGIQRSEYDYSIPVEDAKQMLENLCNQPLIEKTRHKLMHEDHLWEIDEFSGENKGLFVAEIELKSVDEQFTKPDWVGEEVSDDPKYYNVCLVENPFKNWN